MIKLKIEYPFNDNNGLIKHYAEDENGVRYYILQNENGFKYEEAVDVYPCRYTYKATEDVIENGFEII